MEANLPYLCARAARLRGVVVAIILLLGLAGCGASGAGSGQAPVAGDGSSSAGGAASAVFTSPVVVGGLSMGEQPLSGAVSVQDLEGRVLATGTVESGAYSVQLPAGAPASLRSVVTLTGTTPAARDAQPPVLQVTGRNVPGGTSIFVNVLSTLVDQYMLRHPEADVEAASSRVRAWLGLPPSVDLNDVVASSAYQGQFSSTAFLSRAASVGGVPVLARQVIDDIDAGRSGAGQFVAVSSGGVLDLLKALQTGYNTYGGSAIVGSVMLVANVVKLIEYFGFNSADQTLLELGRIQAQIEQVRKDIAALQDQVAQLKELVLETHRRSEMDGYARSISHWHDVLAEVGGGAPLDETHFQHEFIDPILQSEVPEGIHDAQIGSAANPGLISLTRAYYRNQFWGAHATDPRYDRPSVAEDYATTRTNADQLQQLMLEMLVEAFHATHPQELGAVEPAIDRYQVRRKRQRLAYPLAWYGTRADEVVDRNTGQCWLSRMRIADDWSDVQPLIDTLNHGAAAPYAWRLPSVAEAFRLAPTHACLLSDPVMTGASPAENLLWCGFIGEDGTLGGAARLNGVVMGTDEYFQRIFEDERGMVLTNEVVNYGHPLFTQYQLLQKVVRLGPGRLDGSGGATFSVHWIGQRDVYGQAFWTYQRHIVPYIAVHNLPLPKSLAIVQKATPRKGGLDFKAVLTLSDGSTVDVTEDAIWSLDPGTSKARISNFVGESGQLTVRESGLSTVVVNAEYPWYVSDENQRLPRDGDTATGPRLNGVVTASLGCGSLPAPDSAYRGLFLSPPNKRYRINDTAFPFSFGYVVRAVENSGRVGDYDKPLEYLSTSPYVTVASNGRATVTLPAEATETMVVASIGPMLNGTYTFKLGSNEGQLTLQQDAGVISGQGTLNGFGAITITGTVSAGLQPYHFRITNAVLQNNLFDASFDGDQVTLKGVNKESPGVDLQATRKTPVPPYGVAYIIMR